MTGSIHAIVGESHQEAVGWFDKADSLLRENTALAGKASNRAWAADCLRQYGRFLLADRPEGKGGGEVTQRGATLLETLVREGKAEAVPVVGPLRQPCRDAPRIG